MLMALDHDPRNHLIGISTTFILQKELDRALQYIIGKLILIGGGDPDLLSLQKENHQLVHYLQSTRDTIPLVTNILILEYHIQLVAAIHLALNSHT